MTGQFHVGVDLLIRGLDAYQNAVLTGTAAAG
jgi:hypothetical protein